MFVVVVFVEIESLFTFCVVEELVLQICESGMRI